MQFSKPVRWSKDHREKLTKPKAMEVTDIKFDSNNNLKRGRKILGHVRPTKDEGWAYYIGKPSEVLLLRFTGNKEPLTEELAKQRLINAVIPLPF